ncbi:HAMP domain-containing sensor histidine kinase [Nibrella viscosa]|uniref:histidine kinase n=1 Tax=Nibrella viscosa TaxID=1084524 RepID=A0ABP8JWH6_9BACT
MKIRHKIAVQFTVLVAVILLVFCVVLHWTAETQRQQNIYSLLQRRAATTARLLVDVREFDANLLRLLDKNSAAKLPNEETFVFDYKDRLIFATANRRPAYLTKHLADDIRINRTVTFQDGGQEVVGIIFTGQYDRFVVVAAATDTAGRLQVRKLARTLTIGFWIGILLTVGLSVLFARQSLRPFQRINQQIAFITARNLSWRIAEGSNRDEIADLATNFNQMLRRLEQAFRQQKQFVSHASHELRTPLSAMKTEIQVGLEQPHSLEEHRQILANLQNDTERLIDLSNGLLQLARLTDNTVEALAFEPLHLEEVLLDARQEVKQSNASCRITFDYAQLPEDNSSTLVQGNATLLKNAVVNLLSNACKYSPDRQAELLLGFDATHCIVTVRDKGIGIAAEDLPHIFELFYRAQHTPVQSGGFGAGLSVTHRIVELHKGTIDVKSTLHQGSEFTIRLPRS